MIGIALACTSIGPSLDGVVHVYPIPTRFLFVVRNARIPSIRTVYTDDAAISAVRRPGAHRAYLQAVGQQTTIMELQRGPSPVVAGPLAGELTGRAGMPRNADVAAETACALGAF